MVYKKLTIFTIIISIVAAITSNFVFAGNDALVNDQIYDSVLKILIFIQNYSWPVVTLIFIYAMYQFYVTGSEIVENKMLGQRLIVGISIFMVIVQCLPLFYAFVLVN
jgi:hypothetical protein